VPLSVISNWEKQINDYVNKSSKVTVWAGPDPRKYLVDLNRNKTDVLLVLRYARLGFQELQEINEEDGDSSIFDVAFTVILDESAQHP
jgi:hypothetical protein